MLNPTPIPPQPGQESVWDYPRPPRLEAISNHIQVVFNGLVIADTRRALRVLETSHPPNYYLPPEDIQMQFFSLTQRATVCEWKGGARYYTIQVGERRAENAAWYYPQPRPAYAALKEYVAFYPRRMDVCLVDGETVIPQPGEFYGGWITQQIAGPFKGEAGSGHW